MKIDKIYTPKFGRILVAAMSVLSIFAFTTPSRAEGQCTPSISIKTSVRDGDWSATRTTIIGDTAGCVVGDTAVLTMPNQIYIASGKSVNFGSISGNISGTDINLTIHQKGSIQGYINGKAASDVARNQKIDLEWKLNGASMPKDTVTFAASGAPSLFYKWTKVNDDQKTVLSGIVSPVMNSDGAKITVRDYLSAGQKCRDMQIFAINNTGEKRWVGRGNCNSDGGVAESTPDGFLAWTNGRPNPQAGDYLMWVVAADITDKNQSQYADSAVISSSLYPQTINVSASVASPFTSSLARQPIANQSNTDNKPAIKIDVYDSDLKNGDRDNEVDSKEVNAYEDQSLNLKIANTGNEDLKITSISTSLLKGDDTNNSGQIKCKNNISAISLKVKESIDCKLILKPLGAKNNFGVRTIITAKGIASNKEVRASDDWYAHSSAISSSPLGILIPRNPFSLDSDSTPGSNIIGVVSVAIIVVGLTLVGLWRYKRKNSGKPRRIKYAKNYHGLRI